MQKENILIIDDEESILNLSKDILSKSNYTVKTAADGINGLKLFEKEPFDLILTDIKMPGMDGLGVLKQIRANNKEIPVIVITGHGTLDVAVKALRLGAHGFILKPFTPAELRAAIADALEKTRLLAENIRMQALMPLFEVSKEIIGEVNAERLMRLIVNFAVKEVRADKVFLALINERTEELEVREQYNLSPGFVSDFVKTYSAHIVLYMRENKKPFLIGPDMKHLDAFEGIREAEDITCGICVPLAVRTHKIGFFCIGRTQKGQPFTPSEVELMSVLGDHAAAAIENARLYKKLELSYLSTIITLSGVVEAKDFYTDKHMKDIAEYSVEIARKMKLSEKEIEDIRKAALLHDLGKVSVPDSILMKEGKLSANEMEIIKKHPLTGAKMIEQIEPLRYAKEIIKHHQECYDGSGYPDGLKGEEIPLGSRIVGVADAFGAMITDRPYRQALSIERAVLELKEYSGKQFDPVIVEIFISVLQDKGVLSGT
jgi:putative nucleotidyltransferase with HDIG domain